MENIDLLGLCEYLCLAVTGDRQCRTVVGLSAGSSCGTLLPPAAHKANVP